MTRRPPTRPRPATRLGRAFSVASWPVALGLLSLSGVWLVSGTAWELDLIANLNAQWLLGALLITAVWALARRWRPALIGAVACISLLASLWIGRAAIWTRPVTLVARAESGRDASNLVRFFHYNASTTGDEASIESLMDSAHADVLSLLCPPVRYQRDVIYGTHLAGVYPGKLVRRWRPDPDGVSTDITAAFVVSRWPMREIDTAWAGPSAAYLITAVVDRPTGPFAVIAVHPRSPRNAERWRVGNLVVETVAQVADRLRSQGLPVVVLTDLNSTPSGHRSRMLTARAGLLRTKPLISAQSTYPLPLGPGDDTGRGPPRRVWGPFGVAIDDALVSPEIEVFGWSTLPKRESEHSPIVVDLRIPPASTSVAPTAGR